MHGLDVVDPNPKWDVRENTETCFGSKVAHTFWHQTCLTSYNLTYLTYWLSFFLGWLWLWLFVVNNNSRYLVGEMRATYLQGKLEVTSFGMWYSPCPNASLSLDIQNLPEVWYFGPPKQKKHILKHWTSGGMTGCIGYSRLSHYLPGFSHIRGGFSRSSEPSTVFWAKLRSLEGKGSWWASQLRWAFLETRGVPP